MKKFFVAVIFSLLAGVCCFAKGKAPNYILTTTNTPEQIEVVILGHNGDVFTVGRAGMTFEIHRRFLNISTETDILIEFADNDNSMYNSGKNLVNVTANTKTAEDIIITETVLNSLQKESN